MQPPDSVFEEKCQPYKCKRLPALVGRNLSTIHGLAQGTWIRRRNRTMEKALPCELNCLQELFPQHSEEFLFFELEQCWNMSEAVAMVLASDDIEEHSKIRLYFFTKCSLLK